VPPSISVEPASLSVQAPLSATVSVTAGGQPAVAYQWRRDGAPISGATGVSYTLNPTAYPADNGAQFDVVVTNWWGAVTSAVATLTVVQGAEFSGMYYVRTNGLDSYDGLAPVWVSGTNGPKLTVAGAIAASELQPGSYDIVDIGAGTFSGVGDSPMLLKPYVIKGAGTDLTTLQVSGIRQFKFGAETGTNGLTPMVFRNLRMQNIGAAPLSIVEFWPNGRNNHVWFENVSVAGYGQYGYGFRINSSLGQDPNGTLNHWKFQNLTATDLTGGDVLFFRPQTSSRYPIRNFVWDGCNISDNAGRLFNAVADARWYADNWTIKNSTWSRNSNADSSFKLNNALAATFLGANLIDTCVIEDNNGCGVFAPSMGPGASVVIKNSTIRDTVAGSTQATNVYITINMGVTVGRIRVVDTQFGGAGTYGIYIADDGAVPAGPIELKNVNFHDCATGLYISSSTLWYIDPAQSGATIDAGGTLVSGGRMTYYGDANLDARVDANDTLYVGQPFVDIPSGATWAQGDFDGDGDFDADDRKWLPAWSGAMLMVR
jgi:hypothetical protein